METYAKKRYSFWKHSKEEEKRSKSVDRTRKITLRKDSRKGIDHGVAWIILKSDEGEEFFSHAVDLSAS